MHNKIEGGRSVGGMSLLHDLASARKNIQVKILIERSDRRRIAKIEKDWKCQLVVKKEQMKCYGHYNCQMVIH